MFREGRFPVVSPDPDRRKNALGQATDRETLDLVSLLVRAGASEDLATIQHHPPLSMSDAEALVDLGGFAWLLLAANPSSPPALLEKIALGTVHVSSLNVGNLHGQRVLTAIARNPASSLLALFCSGIVAPREVLQSPVFQLEILTTGLTKLSFSRECYLGMLFLAGEPGAPPGLLLSMMQAEEQHCRASVPYWFDPRHPTRPLALIVANRTHLEPELIAPLLARQDEQIIAAVLHNPHAPPFIAERILEEGSAGLLVAAREGNLSAETLQRLLLHAEQPVRQAAFENESLPAELRSLFARTGAFGFPPEPLSLDEQERLLDMGGVAHDLLLENTFLAIPTLDRIARNSARKKRALTQLAARLDLPQGRLALLLTHSEQSVRLAAQDNPSCPAEALALLKRCGATPSMTIRTTLEPAPAELSARDAVRLLRLGSFAGNLLAEHPCASPRLLAEVYRRFGSYSTIARALTRHPRASEDLLRRIAQHESPRVREAAAKRLRA